MTAIQASQDLVSVIIPCYNAEGYIKDAVNSVVIQTYPFTEIIVVDDCSNDKTHDILETLREQLPNLFVFRTKKNSGTPAVPRNIGIRVATGKWIALLDADDAWHPRKLEIQMYFLKRTSSLMCSTQQIDFSGHIDSITKSSTSKIYDFQYSFTKITLLRQLLKYQTPTSSLVFDREVGCTIGFLEDLYFRGREDLIFSLEFHAKFKESIKVSAPLVYYRLHDMQISRNPLHMFIKLIAAQLKANLVTKSYLKIFLPIFAISNLTLWFYLRKHKKVL